MGQPDHLFLSWKVWEHGAPHVAVEIIGEADERDRDWEAKLTKYRRLGVTELVRFDSESSARTLRVWDSVEGDLLERDLGARSIARSHLLSGFWLVIEHPETGLALRVKAFGVANGFSRGSSNHCRARVHELSRAPFRRRRPCRRGRAG